MRIFASRGLYRGYSLVEMRETVIITGWEGRFNYHWECQLLPEQFLEDWPRLWVSRSVQWRCGSTVDGCRVRSTEHNSACTGPFEGGRDYLYHPYHSVVSVKHREGTQPCPSIENRIKVLLSMALPIKTRPSFPHSQSLPLRSFQKPLVRPPHTAILLVCISFPWGWSWSLSPVQCHEPPP